MTIFLQDARTKALYSESEGWTFEPRAATPFKSTIDALNNTSARGLDHVQILLHFDATGLDMTIPLRPRKRSSA